MGFGGFNSICKKTALPLCSLVGPSSSISGSTGIIPNCYARNIELANTIIFEGRKEIITFFYIYMALTIVSLIVDAGVVPPRSGPFAYFVAVQNGLASALCTCLLITGFVGFQLYEDGTALSVWLLRLTSTAMFAISFLVSLLTFKSWGGLSPTNTIGLFVVLYILNAICIVVYLVMQLLLVVNTLEDRWPLGHICFGVIVFIIGQVLLYAFSDTICDKVQHYLDGLFFATFCNLLSVMMVYKFWDYITKEDLEFSVGIKPNNWEVKELLQDDDRRTSLYPDTNSEYASSMHHHRTSTYGHSNY